MLINKTLKPEEVGDLPAVTRKLMTWADEHRTLKVRTNADEPKQAAEAIAFGAEGIGLCRTEHMFFDHIDEFREMILADDAGRPREGAGQAAAVPARRLRRPVPGDEGPAGDDPPARSAAARVPAARRTTEQAELAKKIGITADDDRPPRAGAARVQPDARPPRLPPGHRLSRKSRAMQARAIFEAACDVKKAGIDVHPEVMIPLVGFATEFNDQEKIVRETADKVFAEKGVKVEYLVGTMIEVPRAAIVRRPDRQDGRVLQLRHQRPDADDAGHEPRRLRRLHQLLPRERHHPERSVPDDRPATASAS